MCCGGAQCQPSYQIPHLQQQQHCANGSAAADAASALQCTPLRVPNPLIYCSIYRWQILINKGAYMHSNAIVAIATALFSLSRFDPFRDCCWCCCCCCCCWLGQSVAEVYLIAILQACWRLNCGQMLIHHHHHHHCPPPPSRWPLHNSATTRLLIRIHGRKGNCTRSISNSSSNVGRWCKNKSSKESSNNSKNTCTAN